MSYDEGLAQRVREVLSERRGVAEKKMFGGLAFLLEGSMFCGIVKEDLMVRVGPARNAEALAQAHARPMDFTGKPMAGYVFVAPDGYASDEALARWVGWGAEFVSTMPAKKPGLKREKPAPEPRATAAKKVARRER
jgi:hypothetical protein